MGAGRPESPGSLTVTVASASCFLFGTRGWWCHVSWRPQGDQWDGALHAEAAVLPPQLDPARLRENAQPACRLPALSRPRPPAPAEALAVTSPPSFYDEEACHLSADRQVWLSCCPTFLLAPPPFLLISFPPLCFPSPFRVWVGTWGMRGIELVSRDKQLQLPSRS